MALSCQQLVKGKLRTCARGSRYYPPFCFEDASKPGVRWSGYIPWNSAHGYCLPCRATFTDVVRLSLKFAIVSNLSQDHGALLNCWVANRGEEPSATPPARSPLTSLLVCAWRTGVTLDADIGEAHRGQPLGIMRTNSDPDVDRILHRDGDVGKSGQLPVGGPRVGGEPVTAALDAKTRRAMFGRGHVRCLSSSRGSVLQCDVSVGVDGIIGVSRRWVEALAEDQNSLFQRGLTAPGELDVGGQSRVPGHSNPTEMEVIGGAPHIGSAARHAIEDAGRLVTVSYTHLR